MAGMPVVLPSARIFVGPGDEVSQFDRLWVVLYAGASRPYSSDYSHCPQLRRFVVGRDGEDRTDLELLTDLLGQCNKGTASASRQPIGRP